MAPCCACERRAGSRPTDRPTDENTNKNIKTLGGFAYKNKTPTNNWANFTARRFLRLSAYSYISEHLSIWLITRGTARVLSHTRMLPAALFDECFCLYAPAFVLKASTQSVSQSETHSVFTFLSLARALNSVEDSHTHMQIMKSVNQLRRVGILTPFEPLHSLTVTPSMRYSGRKDTHAIKNWISQLISMVYQLWKIVL